MEMPLFVFSHGRLCFSVIRFSVYVAQIHRSRISIGKIEIIGGDKHCNIIIIRNCNIVITKFSITKQFIQRVLTICLRANHFMQARHSHLITFIRIISSVIDFICASWELYDYDANNKFMDVGRLWHNVDGQRPGIGAICCDQNASSDSPWFPGASDLQSSHRSRILE